MLNGKKSKLLYILFVRRESCSKQAGEESLGEVILEWLEFFVDVGDDP